MARPERSGYCARHRVNVYDDQCEKCDDDNPYITRYFVAAVTVTQDDMTDGNGPPTEIDWTEFESEISKAIKQPHSSPYQIIFDEWEE